MCRPNHFIHYNKTREESKMDNKNIYHYVYRITNIVENKHYYGSRTCECHPSEDIGILYFSSSRDKEFKNDQIENKENYIYKIVSIHETREDAIKKEIKLHEKFEVGQNSSFYNRAKQSTNGFISTNRVSVKDKDNNYFTVDINDPRYLNGELVGVTKNMSLVEENGKCFYIDKSSDEYKSGKYTPVKIGYCKPGKVFSEEHRKNLSKSAKGKKKSKQHIENLKANRPNFKGRNHPRHKYIYVTPIGEFDSPAALEEKGILSLTKMKSFCIRCDRIISYKVYKNCKLLQELYKDYERDLKRKTYRDIGFYTK